MAQALFVYLVDLETVIAAIGSGNDQLIDTIATEQAELLEEIDDQFETAEEHGPGITAKEVLAEWIAGEFSLNPFDHVDLYDQVFSVLCQQYGGRLIDDRLSRCDVDWLDRLDSYLEAVNLPVRLNWLWSRPGLLGNRHFELYLEVGFWTATEAALVLPVVQELIPKVRNAEDREAFEAVADWCRQSAEWPACTLIGSLG